MRNEFLLELRAANVARQVEWSGASQVGVNFRAVEMAGEIGEALNAIKKWYRATSAIAGNTADQVEEIVANLKEELADVVITVDLLGMTTNATITPVPMQTTAAETGNILDRGLGIFLYAADLAEYASNERNAASYDFAAMFSMKASRVFHSVGQVAQVIGLEDIEQAVRDKFNKTSIKVGLETRL